MKNATSFIRYMSEREAIFRYEEYSYAKHAHFQDKQKFRTGMSSQEESPGIILSELDQPLVLSETGGFLRPILGK